MDDQRQQLMRHLLAALAYRTRSAIAGAPANFASFAQTGKTPVQILSHMGDLIAWPLSWYAEAKWAPAKLTSWDEAVQRFFTLLHELDAVMARGDRLNKYSLEQMLQGPVGDALTHVGQLAMMRRLAGAPTKAENFAEADVRIGALDPPAASTTA